MRSAGGAAAEAAAAAGRPRAAVGAAAAARRLGAAAAAAAAGCAPWSRPAAAAALPLRCTFPVPLAPISLDTRGTSSQGLHAGSAV
jgi:hypothetical protein